MNSSKKLTMRHPVSVAAHRGDSSAYAENTMSAFRAAVREHVDMVETDIHLSRDFIPVLMHDDKLDRTTDGTGFIRDYTYQELCHFNCNPHGLFEQIPTLWQFLELCAEHSVAVNLEIKEYYSEENADRCRLCIHKTLDLVEYYGMAEHCVINCFDAYVLEYIAKKYHGRYLLHGYFPYSIMSHVEENPDNYLYCACIFDDRTSDHYRYLEERGIEPWVGAGVREPEHFETCAKLGARLFTTNYPEKALSILDGLQMR